MKTVVTTALLLLLAVAHAAPSRPLILVPGYLGSSLDSVDADGNSEVAWVRLDGQDVYLGGDYNPDTGLFENIIDGTKLVPKPGSPGNLGAIESLAMGMRPYFKNMVKALVDQQGYTKGEDLWAFPYDWRQAVSSHSGAFAELVSQLAETSADGTVDVVAHSMGTLVTKMAIATNEELASKINGWVLLGGPINGVSSVIAEPLGYWLPSPTGYVFNMFSPSGAPAALDEDHVGSVTFTLNGEEITVKAKDDEWPAFAEEAFDGYVHTFSDGTEMTQGWRQDIYEDLDHEKQVLWNDMPDYTSHIRVFNMVGDLGPDSTYLSITYAEVADVKDLVNADVIGVEKQEGDGTVPLWSAIAEGAVGEVTRLVVPNTHGELVEADECIQQILEWLLDLA